MRLINNVKVKRKIDEASTVLHGEPKSKLSCERRSPALSSIVDDDYSSCCPVGDTWEPRKSKCVWRTMAMLIRALTYPRTTAYGFSHLSARL
jgi:hypothetical protein